MDEVDITNPNETCGNCRKWTPSSAQHLEIKGHCAKDFPIITEKSRYEHCEQLEAVEE